MSAAMVLCSLGLADAAVGDQREMTVLRVLGDRVEISLSSRGSLAVNDRLLVERGGGAVAEMTVLYVGSRTASCRIERELRAVAQGDTVRELSPTARPAMSAPPQPTAPPPTPTPPTPPTPEPAPAEPAASVEAGSTIIRVRQVLSQEVFLDAGRAAGLVVGQHVAVLRDGKKIAEVQVENLANRSASCRILEKAMDIATGDIAVAGAIPPEALAAAAASEAARRPASGGSSIYSEQGGSEQAGGGRGKSGPSWADPSGSIALRFQSFRDDDPAARNTDQVASVVNLNLGQLGGGDHEFRLRMKNGQDRVSGGTGASQSRSVDRLYELTMIYEPEGASVSYQVGRLIAGPLVGFDYLDGAVGEYHLSKRWSSGLFYGTRSNTDELNFDATGRSYGAFAHYLNQRPESPYYAEYVIGAMGDYERGVVDREYLSVYGRQGSGSRWSLYERAELDVNRDWKAVDGTDRYQVSNVLLSGSYSLSKALRLGVTYDQRRQVRRIDDRFTPEQEFDDSLREGVRFTVYLGSSALRANASVGQRRRQGSPERSLTYNGSIFHSNVMGWNLLLGADYSAYDGDTSKGYRAGLRVQKYFGSGHDVELTVGTIENQLLTTGTTTNNEWIRLAGTVQLGRRFFLLGEYEVTTGDELAGKRIFLQLGYRL
jgi:hypothetical protein